MNPFTWRGNWILEVKNKYWQRHCHTLCAYICHTKYLNITLTVGCSSSFSLINSIPESGFLLMSVESIILQWLTLRLRLLNKAGFFGVVLPYDFSKVLFATIKNSVRPNMVCKQFYWHQYHKHQRDLGLSLCHLRVESNQDCNSDKNRSVWATGDSSATFHRCDPTFSILANIPPLNKRKVQSSTRISPWRINKIHANDLPVLL